MSELVRRRALTKWIECRSEAGEDLVAHEEPLEIQIQGTSVAVVMRTPGHDEELVLGFLATERVIAGRSELASIRHCTVVPDPEAEDNVMQVRLAPGLQPDLERLRRNLFASTSCGICGKASIANLAQETAAVESSLRVSPGTLYLLPDRLLAAQHGFALSGGLHAAGLFSAWGELLVLREDVGRHNAVDKVIGWSLSHPEVARGESLLLVSGRLSFEIVQKAAVVGIALVAAISAPSSLAIGLAQRLGVTLVGFLRAKSMNVYCHPERIAGG